jgi:tetratricopeptide (TPR) repeat protein
MFTRQVKLAPIQANPHDSLGDGYRAAGMVELAMSEYRKALQIDPEFEHSRKKLKELEENKKKR